MMMEYTLDVMQVHLEKKHPGTISEQNEEEFF